jgi:hypothetical protein
MKIPALKKWFKSISYILIISILLLVFIATTGIIIIRIYGDEVKTYAINSLNKELAVKIEVDKIDLTVFRQFPYISIVLNNVTAHSSDKLNKEDFPGMDSKILFKAEHIFLNINMLDILRGQYSIRRMLGENGEVFLLTDNIGEVNYNLFKHRSEKNKNDFTINLQLVKLNNFKVIVENKNKELSTRGQIKSISLKGNFSKRKFNLTFLGSFFLESLVREGILWADRTTIVSNVSMHASDSVFTIVKGGLELNELKLETSGQLSIGELINTDLQLTGKGMAIQELVKILPENIKSKIKKYSPSGKADAQLSVKGPISSISMPSIMAEYIVSNGRIKLKEKVEVSNISFHGSFTNGTLNNSRSSSFRFNSINARLGSSQIEGSFYIENMLAPYIIAEIKGEVAAIELNGYLNKSLMVFTTGNVYPDLRLEAKLNSFSDLDLKNIVASNLAGNLDLSGIGIRFTGNYPEITKLDGKLNVENDIWLTEFNLETTSGDISFDGRMDYVLKRFVQNTSSLWVQGNVASRNSDLTFLLNMEDSGTDTLFLPQKLFLKLDVQIGEFLMAKFRAADVRAFMNYKPGFINFSTFSMNALSGSIQGYGGIIQDTEGKLMLRTSTQLQKIDIEGLFETFNNFSQDFITYKNLGGRLSGTVELATLLKTDLIPDSKNTTAEADFLIENGELKDFEPLRNLSRFIEVSELEHVKFKTLQNSIVINNSKVFIPDMDIKSSAFNISASGEHGFDNEFDYKVKVNLSEILSNKAKVKKENNEFIVLEKEGERVNIFLHIYGNPDDFKIKYDRREAVQQIKKDIVEEKKVLKTLLNEELGLFKKQFPDSTTKETPPPKFILEWEETEEAVNEPEKNGKKKKVTEKNTNPYQFDWD